MPENDGQKRRGRRQHDIIGYGPAQTLAQELRAERDRVGRPTHEEIAKRGHICTTSVSDVLAGKKLPSLDMLKGVLTGIGIADADSRSRWEEKLADAEAHAATFRSVLDGARTVDDLIAALCKLVDGQGLTTEQLCDRIAETVDRYGDGRALAVRRLPARGPGGDQVAAILGGTAPPDAAALSWILFAAGGAPDDLDHWTTRLVTIRAEERARAVAAASVGTEGDTEPEHADATAAGEPEPSGGPGVTPPEPPRPTGTEPPQTVHPRWLPAAIAVVIVGALVAAGLHLADGDDRAAGGGGATATPAAVNPSAPTAQGVLADLARRICARPDVPPAEPYIYVRRVMVSTETTGAGSGVTRVDERLWWRPDDRSGVRRTTGDSTNGTERFGPGMFREPFEGEPSTDPDVLFEQMTADHPARVGPARAVRGAGQLNDHWVLAGARLCAQLGALASAPGLVDRGQAVDLQGRPGIAVSADDAFGTTRETLIVDPETGQVLGHETADISGPVPVVTSRVAYVERGRVAFPTH